MPYLDTLDWRWWITEQQAYLSSLPPKKWIAQHWGEDALEDADFIRAVLLAMLVARSHPDNPKRFTGINFACRYMNAALMQNCSECPAYDACTALLTHQHAFFNEVVKLYTKAYNVLEK